MTAVLVQAREHDEPDDDVEQRGEGGGVDDRGGGGEGVPQACLSQRDLVRCPHTQIVKNICSFSALTFVMKQLTNTKS